MMGNLSIIRIGWHINILLKLRNNQSNDILLFDYVTMNELHIRHLETSPKYNDLVNQGPLVLVNEVIFDSFDESETLRACLRTKDAADASGFDAEEWRRILESKIFGNAATGIRRSIARLTTIMCTNRNADTESLEALLAWRLIPLNEESCCRSDFINKNVSF